MPSQYDSVNDYIAARRAGDHDTCKRIVAEATERHNNGTTDGSELAELLETSVTVPLTGHGAVWP